MSKPRTHVVTSAMAGKRLDRVLRDLMPDLSLGRIAKLIRSRRIRVNDAKSRHQQRLNQGDIITFSEAPLDERWTPKGRARVMSRGVCEVSKVEFSVLYEDEHLLAVHKPPGLLVHGSLREPNASTLIDQVLAYLAQSQVEEQQDDDGRSLSEFVRPSPVFQPSLVHRIDRDTSGAVLIAKTLQCLQELTRMIKKRQVNKRYIGVVKGGLPGGSGEIRAPIARRDHAGKATGRQRVDVGHHGEASKMAVTRYTTLAQRGAYSLAEFELITGRTHQIRAHLRHVGSAIVGDDEYGDRALNRHAQQKFGLSRQFLHAYFLAFTHPITHVPVTVVSPLAQDLMLAFEAMGFTPSELPAPLQGEFETQTRTVGHTHASASLNKAEKPESP